jgi:D-sedoheptulose 7-phosphate isomerase
MTGDAMKTDSASRYFGDLNRILSATEATSRSGVRLALDDASKKAIALIEGVRARGNKVLLVGNGGSAAIVAHIQNDLCKAAGMPAMVFNDIPLLTAFSNDDGYQVAFEKMAELWAKEGDLLIAVSSSGKSKNILNACAACLRNGCEVITLSGFSPANDLRQLGAINFYVPSDSYGMVELAHSILGHFFTDAVAESAKPAVSGADWTGTPAEVPAPVLIPAKKLSNAPR